MAFFVKVIPPHGRARIHAGECKHCRDGQGQTAQDKGHGPTYWHPAYPAVGFQTAIEARTYMDKLGPQYKDTGKCSYCMKEASLA